LQEIEDLALLLKQANQLKREMGAFQKSEAQTAVLKKLYTVSDENRRLRMENLRLKSELNAVYLTGTISRIQYC
jgi:hypothetical protein